MSSYLEAVRESVVIFDGATGTNLQLRNLGPDDFGGPRSEGCNEILVDTRPDVVAELHRSFLDVGSDVVETDSFGSLPWVLAEYGLETRAHELAAKSAEIARDVMGSPGSGRWVAGSLGPGTKIASLGQISFADMRDGYQVAAEGLLAGGVDLFVIETVQDLLQAKAAIIACRRAMYAAGRQVPIQVQVTIETTGRMLMGTEIGAALTTLEALRPDVIGLNCATGPAEMSEHLRYLSHRSRTPDLRAAERRIALSRRRGHALRPDPRSARAAPLPLRSRVRGHGRRGLLRDQPRTPEGRRRRRARARPPRSAMSRSRAGVASIYSHVPYDQTPSDPRGR